MVTPHTILALGIAEPFSDLPAEFNVCYLQPARIGVPELFGNFKQGDGRVGSCAASLGPSSSALGFVIVENIHNPDFLVNSEPYASFQ